MKNGFFLFKEKDSWVLLYEPADGRNKNIVNSVSALEFKQRPGTMQQTQQFTKKMPGREKRSYCMEKDAKSSSHTNLFGFNIFKS